MNIKQCIKRVFFSFVSSLHDFLCCNTLEQRLHCMLLCVDSILPWYYAMVLLLPMSEQPRHSCMCLAAVKDDTHTTFLHGAILLCDRQRNKLFRLETTLSAIVKRNGVYCNCKYAVSYPWIDIH